MDRLSIVRLIRRAVGVLLRVYNAYRFFGWVMDLFKGPDE